MDEPNIGALAGKLYDLLKELNPDDRTKVMGAALVLFGESGNLKNQDQRSSHAIEASSRELNFAQREDLSPKQFLYEKQPATDIERIACLAYYLTHYRDTPHFKTIDISKLNTEAAQIKFSNAAKAVNNAATKGFITTATKGNKQISAFGEEYVVALPDKELAKQVIEKMGKRSRRKRASNSKRK